MSGFIAIIMSFSVTSTFMMVFPSNWEGGGGGSYGSEGNVKAMNKAKE